MRPRGGKDANADSRCQTKGGCPGKKGLPHICLKEVVRDSGTTETPRSESLNEKEAGTGGQRDGGQGVPEELGISLSCESKAQRRG